MPIAAEPELKQTVQPAPISSRILRAAGIKGNEIEIENSGDIEVLVYVAQDPDCMRMVSRKVSVASELEGECGPVNMTGAATAEMEFEARGDRAPPQRVRVKPRTSTSVAVNSDVYISVFFFTAGLYHRIHDQRLLRVGGTFRLLPRHFQSEVPFKASTSAPRI